MKASHCSYCGITPEADVDPTGKQNKWATEYCCWNCFEKRSAAKGSTPPIVDLTLRDYFAAQVTPGIWAGMADDIDNETCSVAVAQKAYMVADAMLKERTR